MELNYLKPLENISDGVDEKKYLEILNSRENALQELLEVLEYTLKNAKKICRDEKYLMHIPVIMILAFWREKQSYRLIVEMAKLPPEIVNPLLKDIITDDLASIFASVYDGNPELLIEVVENQNGDSFVKNAAIDAFKVLLIEGVMTRDEIVIIFKRLFNESLDSLDEIVIEHLIETSLEIHPDGLCEEIINANNEEILGWYSRKIDKGLEETKNRSIAEVVDELKEDTWFRMVSEGDVLLLPNWLGKGGGVNQNLLDTFFYDCFENGENDFSYHDCNCDCEHSETVVKEIKVGGNEPCPCGSGKKYKKCCLK